MRRIILLLSLVFVTKTLSAQYETDFPKWIDQTPISCLYLDVKNEDTTTEYAQKILKIVRDNWTISPVKIWGLLTVEKNEEKVLKPGNAFLDISFDFNAATATIANGTSNKSIYDPSRSEYYYFLNFWTVKTGKKSSIARDEVKLVRSECTLKITPKPETFEPKGIVFLGFKLPPNYDSIKLGDYSILDEKASNYMLNIKPGFIKNTIQYAVNLIKERRNVQLYKDYDNKGLEITSKDTLFVPNYWYGDAGAISTLHKITKEKEAELKNEVSEILKAYPHPIKLISRDELSDRILATGKKNLFYLSWIQSHDKKIISVVNGKNGEVIYSRNVGLIFNLKPRDLKLVGRAVGD
ncbi:MAG: hypothetical protein ACOVO1_06015 [Chitinophagaceae bacterium]